MSATLSFQPTPTGLASYSPGLAQQRLPWVSPAATNPERVEANLSHMLGDPASTPTGLGRFFAVTQGSGCAATLGYMLATLSGLPFGHRKRIGLKTGVIMKALIKINLPNFNYAWLKAEMVANGFIPVKSQDEEACYNGPDYQFYWNGNYIKDDLENRITRIFAKKNDSLSYEMSPASGAWTITPLN